MTSPEPPLPPLPPLAVPSLAGAFTGQQQQIGGATVIRTARVVRLAGTTVGIDFGDSLVDGVAYLASYVPVLGDVVVIASSGGASWFVVGALAGVGAADNMVADPSFETDAVGATTFTHWTKYVASGTATVRIADVSAFAAVDGLHAMEVTQAAGTSDTALLSKPINVVPGEQWAVAVSWLGYATGASPVAPSVSLAMTWYAQPADTYPTVSSADTVVQTSTGQWGSMPTFATLRDQSGAGATVPQGAAAMRVKLRAVLGSAGAVFFDRVLARRIA